MVQIYRVDTPAEFSVYNPSESDNEDGRRISGSTAFFWASLIGAGFLLLLTASGIVTLLGMYHGSDIQFLKSSENDLVNKRYVFESPQYFTNEPNASRKHGSNNYHPAAFVQSDMQQQLHDKCWAVMLAGRLFMQSNWIVIRNFYI